MVCSFHYTNAQTTKTIKAGAFIVDMGVVPQTVGNGLKPYGLIYELLKNYQVPILWSINPTKLKDGIDFSIGANNYKGGPFIIEADYRTDSVNARILAWQALGVVGVTTTAPLTVPVGTTLIKAPNWTLDKQNGLVAIPYFTNAGIPSTAYGGSVADNWKNPADLGACDDVFIMPHADPTWATHKNLLDWNLNAKGGIWLGCSAGSHLEGMFNPADFTQQTNFLTEKIGLPSGTGPSYQNALKLAENHEDGIPPYTYDPKLQSDPIMQFMDILDNAVLNGAERIYIPLSAGWRATTNIGIYQAGNAEIVDTAKNHRAAIIAWGYAFGDVNRGKVFIEASHKFNSGGDGGTAAVATSTKKKGKSIDEDPRDASSNRIASNSIKALDNDEENSIPGTTQIAAQRVFFNFSFTAAVGKDVVPTITGLPNNAQVMYSGQTLPLAVTVPTGSNINSYAVQWSSSSGGTFSPSATSATTTFIAPAKTGICQLSVTITDGCKRVYFDSKPVDIQCQMTISPKINDVCYSTIPNGGSIFLDISNGAGPFVWKYKKTGATDSVSGTGTTISGLSAGTYGVTVKGSNGIGCVATFNATLVNLNSFTVATNTTTNLTSYGANNGAATISVTGSNPTYTYLWSNGATTQNLSSIAAGNYSVTVTDSKGCKATLANDIVITQPASIEVTPTLTNVNCNGNNTGAISLAISGGATPYTFAWEDGVTTQNRTSLIAGTYSLTITDANGSTKKLGYTITQPIAALNVSESHNNLSCSNSAAIGTISLTVTGGTTAYTYAWSKTGDGSFNPTTQNLSSLGIGTYSVTVTDNKACQVSKTIMITKPAAIAISSINANLTCNASADGSATITVTGGTGTYTYAWAGPSSYTATTKNITSLAAGNYTLTVTDANSCTFNLSTSITQPAAIVVTPTITNVNCNGQTTGAASIAISGGTASYTYAWSDGSALSSRTGLAAGNYTFTVTDANSCKKASSIAITQPALLSVSETHTNLPCSNSALIGTITLTVAGGASPYTYAWTKTGVGAYSATTKNISSLGNGNYNVTITDANSCVASSSIEITKPTALSISSSISQPSCPPLIDGSITLTVTGGTGTYSYNWGGGVVTQNRSSIGPATYNVTVTDANGCTNTISPILTYQNPSPITPSNIKH